MAYDEIWEDGDSSTVKIIDGKMFIKYGDSKQWKEMNQVILR